MKNNEFNINVEYYTSIKNGDAARIFINNVTIYRLISRNNTISFRILLDKTYPLEIEKLKHAITKLGNTHKVPIDHLPQFKTGEEIIQFVTNNQSNGLTDEQKQNLLSNSKLLNTLIVRSKLKLDKVNEKTFVDRKAKPTDVNLYINQYSEVNLSLVLGKNIHPEYGLFLSLFCNGIQFKNPPKQYDSGFKPIDDPEETDHVINTFDEDIPF